MRDRASLTTSPFLLGAFAPVMREISAYVLPVAGTLPAELDGLFTQIGPNPIKPPKHTDVDRYQWFAQDGMVSGVRIRHGRAEWFRNRWVRSSRVTRALGEPRTPGPRHFPVDTVHTNVVGHAGLLLALVETGCAPVRLDNELGTVCYDDLDGALPHGASAHPKVDPRTGELHAVVYSPLRTWAEYTVLTRTGALRSCRRIALDGRPMLHDIALTDRHVLLFDSPVRFQMIAGMRGRFPYRWDERHQTRLGVVSRDGTAPVRWFDIQPCFVFHMVTADETDEVIRLRAVRYRRLFESGAADPLNQGGQLWQWRIDLRSGTVTEQQLDDRLQELPRVNPLHVTCGARFHYSITAAADRISSHIPESLLKHDLHSGTSEIRPSPPRTVPTEAVFVPSTAGRSRPENLFDRDAEDDGWLLHFNFDEDRGVSDLIVLNARDFTGAPAAVITLPGKVPFGFHSSWIPGDELPAG